MRRTARLILIVTVLVCLTGCNWQNIVAQVAVNEFVQAVDLIQPAF